MIRTQVRQELARQIQAAGITGDADVSAFYPGDKHQTREMVFADTTEGQVTFPYGMAPPLIQRDQFTVAWVVRIQALPSLEEAMVRRDELAALIVGLLAGTDLRGFEADGERVTDTNPDGQGITVTSREGETKEGAQIAIAEITVPFETQSTTS